MFFCLLKLAFISEIAIEKMYNELSNKLSSLSIQGFSQECLRGGGGKMDGGLGFLPQVKKIRFYFFLLKMAYFNWNDSKIWNIF